jgi:hypothetical protein
MIMVGELLTAFCERSIAGTLKAFELWTYPDGTLNIVVVSEDDRGKQEACFPCAAHQLQAVIDGKQLQLDNGSETLRLIRLDDFVSAEFSGGWRQCLEVEALQDALDRMQFSQHNWLR